MALNPSSAAPAIFNDSFIRFSSWKNAPSRITGEGGKNIHTMPQIPKAARQHRNALHGVLVRVDRRNRYRASFDDAAPTSSGLRAQDKETPVPSTLVLMLRKRQRRRLEARMI